MSVGQKNKRSTMLSPVSNSSASSCTARSDGSGRLVNRIAAKRLPRDLVRPGSGQQQLAQTNKTSQDIRSLTCANLHARDSHLRPSRRSNSPLCILATSTASMSTGLQQYIPWRWESELLGNNQQSRAALRPKRSRHFLLLPMVHRS